MNYHMIRTDDMLNGDGLRVVVFVSGCDHSCKGCHNPETWDKNSGKPFTQNVTNEIIKELHKSYISGVTLSGGDPLNENNLDDVFKLINDLRKGVPNKTIWIYTGYKWEDIFENSNDVNNEKRKNIIKLCDVMCDGEFIEPLADVNYHWAGSTNQRIINIRETINLGKITLLK